MVLVYQISSNLVKQFLQNLSHKQIYFFINSFNSSSEIILIPSAFALSNLDPGFSPSNIKSVFFETEPETSPPFAKINSVASFLDSVGRVPVSTNFLPAIGEEKSRCFGLFIYAVLDFLFPHRHQANFQFLSNCHRF